MSLTPLPDDQWTDRTRSALGVALPADRLNPQDAGNALATLARHPDLAEAFLTYSGYLTERSTLPDRLRELAALRVARRRACVYAWAYHAQAAAKVGLSPAEIDAASRGTADDELDNAVLGAVDQLEKNSRLSRGTWGKLGEYLDERQRMDLVFAIGTLNLMATVYNTFGIEPDTPSPSVR